MIPRHLIIAVAIFLAITLGMGFYVLRMRARVDRTDVSAANTQPVAPPVSGSSEQVTLYVAYDDAGVLTSQGRPHHAAHGTPGTRRGNPSRLAHPIPRQVFATSLGPRLGYSRPLSGRSRTRRH